MSRRRRGAKKNGGVWCEKAGRSPEGRGSGEIIEGGEGRSGGDEGEGSSDGESVLMGPLVSRSAADLLNFGDSERDGDLRKWTASETSASPR